MGIIGPTVDYTSTGWTMKLMFRRFAFGDPSAKVSLRGYERFRDILDRHAESWKEAEKALQLESKGSQTKAHGIQSENVPVVAAQQHASPSDVVIPESAMSDSNSSSSVNNRERHQPPCDDDCREASSQPDGESFAEDPSSETANQAPDETLRNAAPGQHATSVNSPQTALSHITFHNGSNSSTPVSDAQPAIVLRSTVSMKELSIIFPHGRQRGRETYLNYRWTLKPMSEINVTRPFPDGYIPFTPIYENQQFEGLRMIEIPNWVPKPPRKLPCIFGCKRDGSHFFLCTHE